MRNATGTLRAPLLCLTLATGAGTAGAIEVAREDVRAFSEEMQSKHGFDAAWIDGVLANAVSQPKIIERMKKPAEKVLTWHQYSALMLTEERIAAGVQFWTEHRERLAVIERETGVSTHVIVGILGVETYFGRITGKDRVLDALATLAFDYPPRGAYFRRELEEFLLLAREEQFDVATVQGSYAGAMGRAQFMPSSYRAYTVDGDGDDRRDLWGSWGDVIASIANYLARHGWRAGEPIVADAGLWFPVVSGITPGALAPDTTVKTLRDRGLRFDTTQDGKAAALFIRIDGESGPEYRAGFHNFGVITKYNRSVLYALAVDDLGRRIQSLVTAAP